MRSIRIAALSLLLTGMIATAAPAHAVSTTVVINEVQTRGDNGGNDEFIELRNVSASEQTITGFTVFGCNSTGSITNRFVVGEVEGSEELQEVVLQPGESYLATNDNASGNSYDGPVPGDQTYGQGVADDGGVRLSNGTTIIDEVGFSATTPCLEGDPAPAHPGFGTAQDISATRADGVPDTDENSIDFTQSTAPTPMS